MPSTLASFILCIFWLLGSSPNAFGAAIFDPVAVLNTPSTYAHLSRQDIKHLYSKVLSSFADRGVDAVLKVLPQTGNPWGLEIVASDRSPLNRLAMALQRRFGVTLFFAPEACLKLFTLGYYSHRQRIIVLAGTPDAHIELKNTTLFHEIRHAYLFHRLERSPGKEFLIGATLTGKRRFPGSKEPYFKFLSLQEFYTFSGDLFIELKETAKPDLRGALTSRAVNMAAFSKNVILAMRHFQSPEIQKVMQLKTQIETIDGVSYSVILGETPIWKFDFIVESPPRNLQEAREIFLDRVNRLSEFALDYHRQVEDIPLLTRRFFELPGGKEENLAELSSAIDQVFKFTKRSFYSNLSVQCSRLFK